MGKDADLADPISDKMNDLTEGVDDTKISEKAEELVKLAVKARDKELKRDWETLTHDGKYEGMPLPSDWKAKESDYTWIVEYFKPFYDRPLGEATAMADNLKSAKGFLNSGKMSVFKSASDAVGKWAGDSRDNFKEYFLDPFPQAIDNQQGVLDELRAGLYVYEGIQRAGRDSAYNIAAKTAEALDPDTSGFSFKSNEMKLLYTVVGIAAGIAAATVSAGGLTALSGTLVGKLTMVGTAAFATGGAAGYEPTQVSIDGPRVPDKLQSMVDRLNNLQEDMLTEEKALAKSIDTSATGIESILGDSSALERATLLPHEPVGDGNTNLTDGKKPDPDEFRPRV